MVAKRVAAVAPAKALKPAAHTAAVKQQRLAVVATAKPTIAKGKMLDGEEAAPAEEAPAEEAPAEDAPAAADDAAPAEGDAPAAEDAPAPAPAAAEGASDEPEGVIKDDDVASDIGSLKPTGAFVCVACCMLWWGRAGQRVSMRRGECGGCREVGVGQQERWRRLVRGLDEDGERECRWSMI